MLASFSAINLTLFSCIKTRAANDYSDRRDMLLFRLVGLLFLPGLTLCQIFNLSQLEWTLRNQNGSIVVPASIPSQAHLDLLKAGLITEPLLGANGS